MFSDKVDHKEVPDHALTFSPVLFDAIHNFFCCHQGSNHTKDEFDLKKIEALNEQFREHLWEIDVDKVGNPSLQYYQKTRMELLKDFLFIDA